MKLTQDMLVFIQMAMAEQGKKVTPEVVKELEAQEETVLSRALFYASHPALVTARKKLQVKK